MWFHSSNQSHHSGNTIQPRATSSKGPQPCGVYKYHKIYHLRDAVTVQYSDRDSALASRQSNAARGTPAYLAAYPEALTTTLEGLRKEEKQAIQKLADEWNEEGPPDEQKGKEISPSSRHPTWIFLSLSMYQECPQPSE